MEAWVPEAVFSYPRKTSASRERRGDREGMIKRCPQQRGQRPGENPRRPVKSTLVFPPECLGACASEAVSSLASTGWSPGWGLQTGDFCLPHWGTLFSRALCLLPQ